MSLHYSTQPTRHIEPTMYSILSSEKSGCFFVQLIGNLCCYGNTV